MKSGFKETNSIKNQKPKDKPVDGKPNLWSAQCPQYDQRTGDFVTQGTRYGVGINQPIGHSGNPKMDVPCLPCGRVNTMRVDETA